MVYTHSTSHTTPHYTTLHHTTPHLTTPHHTTPHYTTPHHTTPHLTTLHHTTLHHTTLHHTTLHHTTLHHTTSHQSVAAVLCTVTNTGRQWCPLPSLPPLPPPGPFKNYPQVTVYHPNSGNGHAFANVGWTGWLGSITGISSYQMAISEIGVSFPDSTFGKESRFGTPFTVSGSLQCTDGT